MLITAEEFLANQARIYQQNFKDKRSIVNLNGACRHDGVEDRDGYAIVFRHPTDVVNIVSDFAERVGEAVPSMLYQGDSIHTTIALLGMQKRPKDTHVIDANLIDKLSDSISYSNTPTGKLDYRGVLMNSDTVVAEGYASEDFVKYTNSIIDSISDISEGLNLSSAWGGHMTIARFKENRSAEKLGALFALIDDSKACVGCHFPVAVEITYVCVQNETITLTTMDRYKL